MSDLCDKSFIHIRSYSFINVTI